MNMDSQYRKLINSSRWIKIRTEKIKHDPLCERCSLSGIVTPGTEIHHVTPIEAGATFAEKKRLAYNKNNLQTLCRACHVKIHINLKSKSKDTTKQRSKNITSGFVSEFLTKK